MPSRLRNLLLVLAFAAITFGCASADAAVDRPAPPFHRHSHPRRTIGERAAAIALKEVGVPYRWGGISPNGFDCSGLVSWAYGRIGIKLPHSSYALYSEGRRVARSRMKPGDLVFFYGLGHVGMYVGRGRMVHAPHSGTRVQVVKLGSSHYGARLVGARRITHT